MDKNNTLKLKYHLRQSIIYCRIQESAIKRDYKNLIPPKIIFKILKINKKYMRKRLPLPLSYK